MPQRFSDTAAWVASTTKKAFPSYGRQQIKMVVTAGLVSAEASLWWHPHPASPLLTVSLWRPSLSSKDHQLEDPAQ